MVWKKTIFETVERLVFDRATGGTTQPRSRRDLSVGSNVIGSKPAQKALERRWGHDTFPS